MKKISLKISQGFTLIELIVVIAIFSIITTIALFNQGKLNSSILVTNLAYEIALAVREAQTYGVGVRADVGNASFEGGYGAYFDISNPEQIVLFTDTVEQNNNFDSGTSEESSRLVIQNQRGNKITALCRGPMSVPCVNGGPGSIDSLNIIFRRPNPEALMYSMKDGVLSDQDVAGPVYIVVNTPAEENCRVIVVEKTGQIRVDNSTSGFCQNATE